MGGVSGAKMTPNINKYLSTEIDHRNQSPADQFAHDVIVQRNSLLYKITNKERFPVNTCHSEAIVEAAENLLISGRSEDGVVEAIERTDRDFAIGVQWHPEFFMQDTNDPSFLVFKALVEKAGE
jgi:putative glutamine amidotransferase